MNDANNSSEIVKYISEKTEEYSKNRNYGRAFAHFNLLLTIQKEKRFYYEEKFIHITSLWCNELEQSGHNQDAQYCFSQALKLFPENTNLLNQFILYLLRCNKSLTAVKYLEVAHASRPNDLQIEKNLQSLYADKIPQWHFRMLNDRCRNETYKRAIESKLEQLSANESQIRIIDIGTGTGLLSLLAAKYLENLSHYSKIVAVEECDVIAQIARRIFRNNNANVDVAECLSTNIRNQRIYNFLFTEIFDCCIFGERVLSSLIHAHKELLTPDAAIVPYAAKLLVFAIESEELNAKFRHKQYSHTTLKMPESKRKTKLDDPYDAYNINAFNYKAITDVKEVVTVHFNNLQELESVYNDKNALLPVLLEVTTSNTSKCHAFVICFDLILDEHANNIFTTNPLNRDDNFCSCWEQGLIFLDCIEEVTAGDKIQLRMSATNDQLQLDYCLANRPNKQVCNCIEISAQAIAQLNFNDLISSYAQVIDTFKFETTKTHSFLELSPLPIFSLMLLRKLKQHNGQNVKITFTIPRDNLNFLSALLDLNNIDNDCVTILVDAEISDILDSCDNYDLIVYEPMLDNGLLNENFYKNVDILKQRLNDTGKFLPNHVNVCFEVVESKYLDECTKAMDPNVFGFEIANEINKYSVNEMRGLCGSSNWRKLSTIGRLPIYFEQETKETKTSVSIINSGLANGFIYWFESTYGEVTVSTLNSSYCQGAFVLVDDDKIVTTCGSSIEVKLKQDHGLLKIFT